MSTTRGQQFRVYSVEEGIAIIRAIAEHSWPMTINEAFILRDQFDWKPAPDNGRFFVTAVSGGEEDGNIGLDPDDRSIASEINFNLTTRLYSDAEPQIYHIIRSQYKTYVDALNGLYGQGSTEHVEPALPCQHYPRRHPQVHRCCYRVSCNDGPDRGRAALLR